MRRHRPARVRPWLMLAGAVAALAIGDVFYAFEAATAATASYLTMFPLVAAALWLFTQGGSVVVDRARLIDLLAFACAVLLIVWVFVIGDNGLLGRVPPADVMGSLLLIAVALRLVLAAPRNVSAALLLIGSLGLLAGDVVYAYVPTALGETGFRVLYVMWGLAALHPSMVRLTEPMPARTSRWRGHWVALLCASVATPPAVLLVEALNGTVRDGVPIAFAAAITLTLTITRLADSVTLNSEALNRERALRGASADLVSAADVPAVDEAVRAAVAALIPRNALHRVVLAHDDRRLAAEQLPPARPGRRPRSWWVDAPATLTQPAAPTSRPQAAAHRRSPFPFLSPRPTTPSFLRSRHPSTLTTDPDQAITPLAGPHQSSAPATAPHRNSTPATGPHQASTPPTGSHKASDPPASFQPGDSRTRSDSAASNTGPRSTAAPDTADPHQPNVPGLPHSSQGDGLDLPPSSRGDGLDLPSSAQRGALDAPRSSRDALDVPRSSRDALDVARSSRDALDVPRSSRDALDVPRSSRDALDSPRSDHRAASATGRPTTSDRAASSAGALPRGIRITARRADYMAPDTAAPETATAPGSRTVPAAPSHDVATVGNQATPDGSVKPPAGATPGNHADRRDAAVIRNSAVTHEAPGPLRRRRAAARTGARGVRPGFFRRRFAGTRGDTRRFGATAEPPAEHATLVCPLWLEPLAVARPSGGALIVTGHRDALTAAHDALEVLAGQAALALDRISLVEAVGRRDSDLYLRAVISNTADLMLVLDDDQRIRYASPALQELLGDDNLSPLATLEDLVHPDDRSQVRRAFATGGDGTMFCALRRPDHSQALVEATYRDLREDRLVRGFVITMRNVTDAQDPVDRVPHRDQIDDLPAWVNRRSAQHKFRY
ncbi:PAS domain-containing protein [Actinoplanes sp. URMC 104]|uniref:PAS domain-containing protein n=1 Tax=Actinoplanes sp. URMC 104 TaxID=3423409 RepID=UPI003F1CFCAE